MAFPNLSTMHRASADRLGPRAALRWKRLGVYHDLSWTDYRRQADALAAALVDLGIARGDRVGLLSENRPEWLVADMGILASGAADVPLHAPLAAAQVRYQLGHSGARGVLVSDQSQADKVVEAAEGLPDLEWVAGFDPIRVPEGCRLRVFSWDGLIGRGRLASDATAAEVRRREASLGPDDLATILYTSGTTGQPKGVMLSHGNLVSNAEATIQAMPGESDDVLLSWLPYSHIYARTVDHYMMTVGGGIVALAESVDTLVLNLAEVRPHWMTAVPRFYEKIWASVEALDAEARAAALHRVFGPRLRFLSSGGAPLPPHIARGFEAAGIPLLEGYGLTESSPVICFNRLDHHKPGTVGPPIPGVEVRIADDGEILTRGPHVMLGYWRDPEATALAVVDGWLHTGDVGTLDADGFLAITDRKKDLIVTSQGKNVSPAEIERLLVADPYIDQAVVCGDHRPFVSAILVPNLPALREKAAELGGSLESDGEFLTSAPLHAFLADRVEAAMTAVSKPERVRAFLLMARPFSPAEEELTATLKVRRRHILQKFADRLDALYQRPAPPESPLPPES